MTDQPAPNTIDGYPASLGMLIRKLRAAVQKLTAQLDAGDLEAVAWQDTMEQLIARYSTAAYMAGAGTSALTTAEIETVTMLVQTQLSFLDNFTLVIQSEPKFMQGWYFRAEQYADHIVEPYWKGKTRILPLPAMPGDGTFCHCHCAWDIQVVDETAGDYDCYWKLGIVRTSHCQFCEERASEWNPLKIRGGELVL